MGRGFDDLNHFFTVTQQKIQCSSSTELVAPGYDVEKIFMNHEAHWFRSSAVVLHYHKYVMTLTLIIFEVLPWDLLKCNLQTFDGQWDNFNTSGQSMTQYLCLFRWFHPCSERISTENENIISTQINWSPCMRGPVGNGGGCQKDQSYFDDNVFSGLEIFHGEYINALKLLNDSNEMNRKGKYAFVFLVIACM